MIDWSRDASEIARMIDATGFPYEGARTRLRGETIYVDDATVLPDLPFENRVPGKIWRIRSGRPIIVCGSGLLKLDACRGADLRDFTFDRVRSRLGVVDP